MKLDGNTIFITGGGSGIGRGLAEALHQRGNQVIISGRRNGHLEATTKANPGMQSIVLDVDDPASIKRAAAELIERFPRLNVLINNAGIMSPDATGGVLDDEQLVSTVTTNLYGPIRLTSALIEHLKKQPAATVINVSSVLGFIPLVYTAVYSATKAAVHSYTQSLRYRLEDSNVKVLELIPPWVRTELMNSSEAEAAMPLDEFIAGTIEALGTDAVELLVEQAKPVRTAVGPDEGVFLGQLTAGFDAAMAAEGAKAKKAG